MSTTIDLSNPSTCQPNRACQPIDLSTYRPVNPIDLSNTIDLSTTIDAVNHQLSTYRPVNPSTTCQHHRPCPTPSTLSTYRPVNGQSKPVNAIDLSTQIRPVNANRPVTQSTYPVNTIDLSTPSDPVNPSTVKAYRHGCQQTCQPHASLSPIDLSTHRPVNLSTCQPIGDLSQSPPPTCAQPIDRQTLSTCNLVEPCQTYPTVKPIDLSNPSTPVNHRTPCQPYRHVNLSDCQPNRPSTLLNPSTCQPIEPVQTTLSTLSNLLKIPSTCSTHHSCQPIDLIKTYREHCQPIDLSTYRPVTYRTLSTYRTCSPIGPVQPITLSSYRPCPTHRLSTYRPCSIDHVPIDTPFNPSTCQPLIDLSTHRPVNPSTLSKPIDPCQTHIDLGPPDRLSTLSTHCKPSTCQPIDLSTHRPVNPSTCQPIDLSKPYSTCQTLSTCQPIDPVNYRPSLQANRPVNYRTPGQPIDPVNLSNRQLIDLSNLSTVKPMTVSIIGPCKPNRACQPIRDPAPINPRVQRCRF
ncbi:hypothetical protein C7M84_000376 [Penaeus vannamei]|uniref:Uncharacterized protein n=1 Tax=Penaeus vannamei TaxID=6689 RepID=A0A423TWQ9_PENVA|nr:hypothetical protein C7M84_000376 [Penaeus vannamei]